MPKKKAKTTHSLNSVAVNGPQQIPAANQAAPNIQNAGAVNNNNQNNGDLSSASSATKKRKRKKSSDGAYNKATYQKKGKSKKQDDDKKRDVLPMRTDNRVTFKNKRNKTEKVRTTVIFDKKKMEDSIHDVKKKAKFIEYMQANLGPELEKKPTFREVVEIIERNKNGSPIKAKVVTPKKKNAQQQAIDSNIQDPEDDVNQYIVHRTHKFGPASLFESIGLENIPLHEAKMPTAIDPSHSKEFTDSSQYKAIKKIHNKFKLKYKNNPVKITPQLLAKTNKEIAENGGRREKSQNEVQVAPGFKAKEGSSTNYVNATKLHDEKLNLKWEWLHLVAHMILGKLSQDTDNLVAGTTHANTAMIFADVDIPYLAKIYPEGFDLEIWADLVAIDPAQNAYTQIANVIYYKIITKDFTWDLTFHAQNPNKPHIDFGEYLHDALMGMVKFVKLNDQNNNNAAPAVQTKNSASPATPVNDHKFLFDEKQIPNKSNNINIPVVQKPTVKPNLKQSSLKTKANANPTNAGAPATNANAPTTSNNTKHTTTANLGLFDKRVTRSQAAAASQTASSLPPNKKLKTK